MTMFLSRIAALIAIPFLMSPLAIPLIAEESPPSPALTDLAWIAGNWVGGEDEALIHEHWSVPESNTMMGMFRLVQDGKVVFYEFMTLTQEESGPVLRIKHFDPGLEGWEEKNESVVFDLKETGTRRAVFETLVEGNPENLVYERSDDELVITLIKPAKDSRSEFRYRRTQEQ